MPIYFVGPVFAERRVTPAGLTIRRFMGITVTLDGQAYRELPLRDFTPRFALVDQERRDLDVRLIRDPADSKQFAYLVCENRCDSHWPGGTPPITEQLASLPAPAATPSLPPGTEIVVKRGVNPWESGLGQQVSAEKVTVGPAPSGAAGPMPTEKHVRPIPSGGVTPASGAADCADPVPVDWAALGAPACLESVGGLGCRLRTLETGMDALEQRFAPVLGRFGGRDRTDPCGATGADLERDLDAQHLLEPALADNEQAISALRGCFEATEHWIRQGPDCGPRPCPPAALKWAHHFLIEDANALDRRLEHLARRHMDATLATAALRRHLAAAMGLCRRVAW